MKSRSLRCLPKVIHFLGFPLLIASHVQAITWLGNNSANWADPLNWAGGITPDETTAAEFSAPMDGGGISTPSSLVVLAGEERAGSLIVNADVLTLGTSTGPSVLDLRQASNPASSTLEVGGGLLDVVPPGGAVQTVISSLSLASDVTVRTQSGFVGATSGDNAAVLLSGGRLEINAGSTFEVGNADGSGVGAIRFVPGGYGNFVADGATVVIHSGSAFDTNGVNAFASIGTLDLKAGSTTNLGTYFQLWTNNLQFEDGANFTWQTANSYEWSQLWIQNGDFQVDGGGLSTGVFGATPLIDGGKTFKLDNTLNVRDGQTLAVNGTFSGFQLDSGYWNPTWFTTLDVGGITLEGSGAVDFTSGSVGLSRQGLVIGPDGMFQDPDDGFGNPNPAGNLTLDGSRGIAVVDGGTSIDLSESGLTVIRPGATLTIDGGSFFTNRLELEKGPASGVPIDLTGLTRFDSGNTVEFRNGADQVEYVLSKAGDEYVLEDVLNTITYSQEVALNFDGLGQFTGVIVGGSNAGDGKVVFNSGLFGIGTDMWFTGDVRSTISPDANYVIGDSQTLLSSSTVRIGPEFSALDQVSLTLDGGTLYGAAVRVSPGGSLTIDRGSLKLMDNNTDDSNWVVGEVDVSGEGSFQAAPYLLAALDSHLGESLNALGNIPGDASLGSELSVDTENLTLLDGSLLTIDGGTLRVRQQVRNGLNDAHIDFTRGSLTFDNAHVEVGVGGIFGDSVLLESGASLFAKQLTLKSDGNIRVDGGYLGSTNFHADTGKQLDFQSGYIYLGPGVVFGDPAAENRPFGGSLVLDSSRSLAINGPTHLETGTSVTVSGGLLDPSGGLNIAAGASLSWTGGTLGSTSNTFTLDNSGLFGIGMTQAGESRELKANISNSGGVFIQGIQSGTLVLPGAITNSGNWKVTVPAGQSFTVQYDGTYRLTGSGTYDSDPATHEFTNLTVEDQASMAGVSGDRFVVSGNLQNTSTAAWSVSNAELILTGNPHQVSGLTNSNQAFGAVTLEGGATLNGDLTAYNILNVGTDVGIQGALTIDGAMNLEIGDPAKMLAITGSFSLNGPLNLFLSPSYGFTPNQSIQILALNGAPFDFTGKTVNFPSDSAIFDPTTGTLLVTIPEPATPVLAAITVILAATHRRRRQRN